MSPQVAHLPPLPRCRRILFAVCLGLALLSVSSMALAQYQLTNLVSNQVGEARHDDPLLVNAWGLVHPPGGPFWISDNNSGWSTLYGGGGVKQGLVVEIPTASGAGPGSPTGIVFNSSPDPNRVPSARMGIDFPVCHSGWDHQRMGAPVRPQQCDYRGGQIEVGSGVHRLGNHQQG